MPEEELTTEDQLVTDLVEHWTGTPPTGLDDIPVVHFRRTENLPIPAIIIGHEGFQRETAKGMDGTGRVALRIAIRTSLDATTPADHRALASAADQAVAALGADDLALTYVHAVLRESPAADVEDRRQITVLRYTAVCTRCAAV